MLFLDDNLFLLMSQLYGSDCGWWRIFAEVAFHHILHGFYQIYHKMLSESSLFLLVKLPVYVEFLHIVAHHFW